MGFGQGDEVDEVDELGYNRMVGVYGWDVKIPFE